MDDRKVAPRIALGPNGGHGDYTQPIARTGESQYACVMRNRSGESAGEIDFGLRDLTHLGDGGQAAVNTIHALYRAACRQTGLRCDREGTIKDSSIVESPAAQVTP